MAIQSVVEPLSGNPSIDALLDGERWNSNTLTVGFPVASSSWDNYSPGSEPFTGFATLNSAQQQAVTAAWGNWAAVANLTFVPVSEPTQTADIRFAGTTEASTAYTYLPTNVPQGGDVWFGRTVTNVPFWVPGSYQYATAVHEIGHALGLKHPHDPVVTGVTAPAATDSIELSIMSYRSYPDAPLSGYTIPRGSYPTTPMLDDIAAIQYEYGANYATNAGDTVYRFTPDQKTIFQTVWDGGGTDTYDLSAYTTGVSVNLQPGGWSTLSTAQLARLDYADPTRLARGNVANAYLYNGDPRSLIENVVGGIGNDTIVGNQTANVLIGGTGADLLQLPADGVGDMILDTSPNDGGAPGQPAGFDQVTGFESGIDKLALGGSLRSAIDRNGDGILGGAVRGPGEIDGLTDEAVRLSTPLAGLTDPDFASLVAAVGPFVGPAPAHDVLVLASDGTSTGAYLVHDAGAPAQPVASSDVRLLGLFSGNPNVGLGDLTLV